MSYLLMIEYIATIGRNVPDMHDQRDDVTGERIQAPMSDAQWHQFVEDVVADMLSAVPSDICELHLGTGVWDDVEEESAKITLRRSAEASPEMLSELRRLLSENARKYGQDAIALTIGTSELC